MQKKLLALAIAGAMAAPLAAQAQSGSNVTIYGYLKPSIDYVDNGASAGTSMRSNNSLIGFSGSEDLGNGLKAIFQLESFLNFDERGDQDVDVGDEVADGSWVRRDSWLGLSGGFGSLTFGNHQTAYVRVSAAYDPFSDTIGDYNNIMGVLANPFLVDAGDPPAADNADDVFNSRLRNSMYYTSPVFSGFQVLASYALSNDANDNGHESDAGNDENNDTLSLAVSYTWGPLGFLVAYEDQGKVDDDKVSSWKAGVSYKLGTATTLAAIYEDADFGDAQGGSRKAWFVSAKHSIGKIDLAASYTNADEMDDVDDTGAQAFALGAAYNFSKRTQIMAIYARVDNDDDGIYYFDSGYNPAELGDNVSGFSVRLAHRF